MKALFTILVLLISQLSFAAIDTTELKSQITDVTIFFNGAQITRNASLKFNKGKHFVTISKLPRGINTKSIQVKGIPNVQILSVKHRVIFDSQKSSEQLAIEESIDKKVLEIKELKNELEVFHLEEKLLLQNSNLGKNKEGSSIAEIKEAADYYRLRLNEIRKGKLDLIIKLENVSDKIQELNVELNKESVEKQKSYSQILIAIDCKSNIKDELNLNYYLSSAGWVPTYDFRVDDITQPLKIVYNANVFQSTGEDWKNVNIKLSTAKPSLSGDKPVIQPMYLGYKSPYQQTEKARGSGSIRGRVLDSETREPIAFGNVRLEQDGRMINGGTTDIEGQYMIKPVPSGKFDVKVSYVGYKTELIQGVMVYNNKERALDITMESSATTLQAVCVTAYKIPIIDPYETSSGNTINSSNPFFSEYGGGGGYSGGRSAKNETYIDGVRVIGSSNLPQSANEQVAVYSGGAPAMYGDQTSYSYTSSSNTQAMSGRAVTTNLIANTLKSSIVNLEYEIQIPYSIPSDGEDYNIKIKEVDMPVDYVYHAIPKVEADVFLIAKIADWSELNLLSGKSSIYYLGTFTGESFIDVQKTSDTLEVSLGRDRNIVITREGNKKLFDKQVIGKNIWETRVWDISIRNNKSTKIKIIIKDQYPLSDRKSYEVELLESSGARVDEKKGILLWELELEPAEKRDLNFKYEVKYPKYMKLYVE